MNTAFALLARYGKSELELREICVDYFGITPETANQKAKAHALPVPTFKLRNSERSPTLVKVEDLAAYIDKQHQAAKEEWDLIQAAKY
ncbi:pyocin activator PrtN family protein [Pseudoalteromonas tunicata]|jgi:hypothetical protein|uniref:Pyocin activator protein PrtN n=1 Tax=Pseudoalteromonas tunicata D2 TaxID=87626 RepID=A4C8Q7_9GAMM|nr:pyocin activator PrtN family protein [Pseudoalteromonas tunicata]ATC93475.1 hypothetical protein PTUN_a0724 [Pseudoalteromonas tunicata]AXT32515.1 pyocin activator protein PrtN [Pseudoalteromonas tunicata]EAR28972.1 hypothetical protein PTD2_08009 [Pseudoalteromonas tunicata D2]